jgi:hypothetical protein
MPDHPRSFIPGNPFQNLFCGLIQEAQEPDIILPAETMEQFPDPAMNRELQAQRPKRPAFSPIQNRLGHAQGSEESADNAANRRHFHMAGRVADKIDFTSADFSADGKPSRPERNLRFLEFKRLEIFLL